MEWRKLKEEELPHLYSTLNIVTEIKSSMRRMGHLACMGETKYWLENQKEITWETHAWI
jgi:hypothetical protein